MTKEQIQEFTRRTSQENHSGLILVLCDIERVYLDDALAAYNAGEAEQYIKNVELAKRAHNELMSCFNPTDAQGARVLSVLRYLYTLLVASSVRRKPQEAERCIAMLEKLRESFEHLHSLDKEGPVMKNTHQVYAGLTYGRGVLNESTLGNDYGNRGFKA